MRNEFLAFSFLSLLVIFLLYTYVSPDWLWLLVIVGPIIIIGFIDFFQTKDAIKRNFPVVGRIRYLMEELRPKIYQYFIESDTNGTPIPRNLRTMVYERSKHKVGTSPFGTQLNVYEEGYQFIGHSISPLHLEEINEPYITIGDKHSEQPYRCSIYNVSAMSFGSLSNRAVLALNKGAKLGGFAHNTGEGGISPYHLENEGDLIFQVGTGYFGARDKQGNFSDEIFTANATRPSVKMIELKLSQGAKPGHGGILPAKKNTEEISKIRNIEPGTDVLSPPYHTAFKDTDGLIKFIDHMRKISGGKPTGFKLCIGKKSDFINICQSMYKLGIYPDFITIDGGEGGTGAAPLEFQDSIGMPFMDGLAFAHDCLVGFGIRDQVKLLTAGKIISGFHIMRALALGADACYSARAMMLALGCIQALECNVNTCPTGIATQDKELIAGINVKDKGEKVASFHKETIEAFLEMMAAAGLRDLSEINRDIIFARIGDNRVKALAELYPELPSGCLLDAQSVPPEWLYHWNLV